MLGKAFSRTRSLAGIPRAEGGVFHSDRVTGCGGISCASGRATLVPRPGRMPCLVNGNIFYFIQPYLIMDSKAKEGIYGAVA